MPKRYYKSDLRKTLKIDKEAFLKTDPQNWLKI